MTHRRLMHSTVGASAGNLTNQQASRMAVWRVARSLWHEPVWDSMVETVGIGGVGVPISTRWMI